MQWRLETLIARYIPVSGIYFLSIGMRLSSLLSKGETENPLSWLSLPLFFYILYLLPVASFYSYLSEPLFSLTFLYLTKISFFVLLPFLSPFLDTQDYSSIYQENNIKIICCSHSTKALYWRTFYNIASSNDIVFQIAELPSHFSLPVRKVNFFHTEFSSIW